MSVKIFEGVPPDFKRMMWYGDYKKFGVTMEHLINPFNLSYGISFKKEGMKEKSVIISKGEKSLKKVTAKFLEIEKEFGIPKEASKYA